jgi:hypothetical protein
VFYVESAYADYLAAVAFYAEGGNGAELSSSVSTKKQYEADKADFILVYDAGFTGDTPITEYRAAVAFYAEGGAGAELSSSFTTKTQYEADKADFDLADDAGFTGDTPIADYTAAVNFYAAGGNGDELSSSVSTKTQYDTDKAEFDLADGAGFAGDTPIADYQAAVNFYADGGAGAYLSSDFSDKAQYECDNGVAVNAEMVLKYKKGSDAGCAYSDQDNGFIAVDVQNHLDTTETWCMHKISSDAIVVPHTENVGFNDEYKGYNFTGGFVGSGGTTRR